MPRSDHAVGEPHSTAGARHGMCEVTSAVDRKGFGFFRLLRGHSRKLLTRKLLPCGMCLIVLMTMQTADCTEYGLNLKFKSAFVLLLWRVYCVFFFILSIGNYRGKFSYFEILLPKYFEKFLPVIIQTSKQSMKSYVYGTVHHLYS